MYEEFFFENTDAELIEEIIDNYNLNFELHEEIIYDLINAIF